MRVLVTGAAGFVGAHLLKHLAGLSGVSVLALVRNLPSAEVAGVDYFQADLSCRESYAKFLCGVDVVVHCAARAHVLDDSEDNPLVAYRQANVEVTRELLGCSADADVKRFIYLSSIKACAEQSSSSGGVTPENIPKPEDAYGVSKLEAERLIQSICSDGAMEYVIIRPPLVYGPGVKGNFYNLLVWLAKSRPLPFGLITENSRSLLYVDNLTDFIGHCLMVEGAANQCFHVSDSEDFSTAGLLLELRKNLGRSWLLPIPAIFFEVAGRVLGKRAVISRLLGSLRVDSQLAMDRLEWQPPISAGAGMRKTCEWFKQESKV